MPTVEVTDMAGQWWSDDDQLLAEFGGALGTAPAVPPGVVEAARAAFAWRTIDGELAALTHDSVLQGGPVASTRADPAPLRTLTFSAPELTIELEVTDGALLGQLVPSGPGEVEVVVQRGRSRTVPVDEVGCFVVRPIPSGPFRLRCRTADHPGVVTEWTTL
jgi:hypothetical protein